MRKFTLFLILFVVVTTAFSQTFNKTEIQLTTTVGLPGYISSPHDHAVINPNSPWDKGGIAALIDNDVDTHFHTAWENIPAGPHYFQVDLGEGKSISDFCFDYVSRKDGGDDFPSQFTIKGSNDDANYEKIATVDFTMPYHSADATGKTYASDVINSEKAYRYLRFEVTNTKSYNGAGYRVYFHAAEFNLYAMVKAPVYTVTYNYKEGDVFVASVTHAVEEGSEFPDLPSGTSLPYGVTVNGTKPSGTVTGDSQHDIAVTIDLPFEFAATYDEIGESWYYLSIGDAGKLLYHKEGAGHIALDRTEVDKDNRNAYLWAFVGNPFDGYKLVNRAKDKGWILSSSTNTFDNNTGGNTYPIMTEEPVVDGNNTYWVPTFSGYRGGTDAFYLAQKDVNYGKNKMNNRGDILAYWNGGADAGSTFKVRHMNAIEPVIFNWTATTNWTSVDAAECSSSLMWDNRFTRGIKYIEATTEVESSVSATVTFTYTDGDCRLNITGVEVVDANGNIVSGDYHFGYTGGSHDKNIYSVKTFEGGTYTVRCYATEGDWSDKDGNHTDLFAKSNGRITVELVRNDVSAFEHKVTFAAEYATLYLGYDAAIPSGVEAYVVGSTENGYAIMTEVGKVIPAATPVILKKVGVDSEYTFIYENTDPYVGSNLLKGSIANRYVTGDAYVLSNGTKGIGLYGAILNKLDGSAFLNNANKAYLPMTDGVNAASYSFRFEEGTTGIEEVKGENGEVKAIFDLTGRRVEAITAPGIYIVNGKKVLVK